MAERRLGDEQRLSRFSHCAAFCYSFEFQQLFTGHGIFAPYGQKINGI